MSYYVLDLKDIDKTKLMLVGGKGANLGELAKIPGINVPEGFCITTKAFKKILMQTPSIEELIDELHFLKAEDLDIIREISGELRRAIEGISIPKAIAEEIGCFLSKLGEKNPYAVRSSATAEDLPMASLAGLQDTYLNISGKEALLRHIKKCWASLFTERAVIYRLQKGFDHRKVHMSVVVQKMVFSQAAGVLFTADPVTSHRKVSFIDANFGLGEALVSGLVNADTYKVSSGEIVYKKISTKRQASYALEEGGTKLKDIPSELQNRPVLAEEQILALDRIGRKIEGHFGCPQDIEWCLAGDSFYILQSRPITTLFPIPGGSKIPGKRVYVSVGHQQMMTDPIKPLGLSFYLLTTPAAMYEAGGRLFVDVTDNLASPERREILLNHTLGPSDPLIKDALMTIIERKDFLKALPEDERALTPKAKATSASHLQGEICPAIITDFIRDSQKSLEKLKQDIQRKSGSDLFDVIQEDIQRLKEILFDPQSMAVITAAMKASTWINEKFQEWLGEKNAADILSQSVPNNITSQMGLDLLDVADVLRPYPEVIDFLRQAKDEDFLEEMDKLEGGAEARDAILSFLDKYGMRCPGEVDITKARWREKPTSLIPLILSHIHHQEPHSSRRIFEQGREEALRKERELLGRLQQLPGGEQKAQEVKDKIRLMRNFLGFREYPKYVMICRYFVYKLALLKEAEKLVEADIINEKEDIYYLSFEELREVVREFEDGVRHPLAVKTKQIINKRKDDYLWYEKLTPPRVITSEGEIIAGDYRRENLPPRAIAGLPVSSGVVEGRARVILNMEDADLADGDILVTPFTDPGWTPLFVSIKGLVTEVGGLMTHGAVIAREYGLPAVVGVERATKLIRDGQRIRVNGTEGYVEILNEK